MTGATGDLTPDAMGTRPFIPAETREVADPVRQGDVTTSQAGRAPVHELETDESSSRAAAGPTTPATAENDAGERREPRLGGDESSPREGRF